MATITSAGEILTVAAGSDDQRDKNSNSIPYGSSKQYVQFNNKNRTVVVPTVLKTAQKDRRKLPKFDIDGYAFSSDDSEYSCSDDSENDDEGFEITSPISPPPSHRVQSDQERNIYDVVHTTSFGSKKSTGSLRSEGTPTDKTAPTISQSLSSKKSGDSVLSEASAINLRDPAPNEGLNSRYSRLVAVNEAQPVDFNDVKTNRSFDSEKEDASKHSNGSPSKVRESSIKKGRLSMMNGSNHSNQIARMSMMSEATPIHFYEPGERDRSERSQNDRSISLHSRKSVGSELSETTPIRFYESTTVFDFEFDGSDSGSNDTPEEIKQSRRSMGMTMAQRKASQRFQSELFDHAIEEDAERDIVNVYLEASAFADRERINLTEDIYSFVLACSFRSLEFWTAVYFIFVKYLCYGIIFVNLTKEEYTGEGQEPTVFATKFIMIPVAVAMQEDLITVYYNVANKKYDALTYKGNIHATEVKWILSNLLRAIDGLMSLAVNFMVMLLEINLLNIFLSFAALHFLQFIDDVIYELAEKGFFGQKLEQATIQCKIITFTRRTSTGDHCNNFITSLDTILLLSSMAICYVIYIMFFAIFYADEDNILFGVDEFDTVP